MKTLRINEIFYSLQGEGLRKGQPSVFVRLSGCSAKGYCQKIGIKCDTKYVSYDECNLDEIFALIKRATRKSGGDDCDWIVWTGGEPLDQIDGEVLKYFKDLGYLQALETSGVKLIIDGFDWIVLSPKVPEEMILENWPLREDGVHCDELRYICKEGWPCPEANIKANCYYLSPHFDNSNIPFETIDYCIELCLSNPKWSLSVQEHKIWGIK